MEYNFRDFENMDRRSPTLTVGAMVMTYETTSIFSFYPPYEQFDYVIHAEEDDNMNLLDSPELIEQLRAYRFPEYKRQYPDVPEVFNYFDWHSKVLDGELKRIAAGDYGDLEPEPEDDDEPPEGHTAWDWGFEDL